MRRLDLSAARQTANTDLSAGPLSSRLAMSAESKASQSKTLANLLSSSCPITRYEAAQALVADATLLEGEHATVLASLVVRDQSRLVRHAAARALGTLGSGVSPYAAALVTALQDSEMLVRRDAAKALASAEHQALQPHVTALAAALEDDFWPVRLWCCKSLGVCGPEACSVAPSFPRKLATMALKDSDDAVRDMAAKVLPSLGKSAVPHLQLLVETLLSKRKEDDHSSACRALASVLSGPDVQARELVKKALAPVLQRIEEQAQRELKARAASGTLRDYNGADISLRKALVAIETALEDEDWQTRLSAVEDLRTMAVC